MTTETAKKMSKRTSWKLPAADEWKPIVLMLWALLVVVWKG